MGKTIVTTALTSIDHLSQAYQHDGRWNQARQLLEQGIAIVSESGEHDLLKATLQNRLADILWKQGNTDEAESMLLEA